MVLEEVPVTWHNLRQATGQCCIWYNLKWIPSKYILSSENKNTIIDNDSNAGLSTW